MTTYNESGLDYDEAAYTYAGYQLTGTDLLLDGEGVPEVAYSGPTATTRATDSAGTLDVTLHDLVPVLGQSVALYLDPSTKLWDGTVVAVTTDELPKGGHTVSQMNATDAGFAGGSTPASPWDVSDTPNFSTTFPYVRLTGQTRLEDGLEVTTYELVVDKAGLTSNMNIDVTSALHGLSADVFLIKELTVEFLTPDQPRWTAILGESLPQLDQLIADQAANATVANVINTPATVTVDATGLTVTDGAITVVNPEGTVIIDGSGDMFRIIATGTIQTDSFSNPGSNTATINLNTGLDYVPAFVGYLASESGAVRTTPNLQIGSGSAAHVDWQWELWINSQSGGLTTLKAAVRSSVVGGTTQGYTFRFYIFEQTAI